MLVAGFVKSITREKALDVMASRIRDGSPVHSIAQIRIQRARPCWSLEGGWGDFVDRRRCVSWRNDDVILAILLYNSTRIGENERAAKTPLRAVTPPRRWWYYGLACAQLQYIYLCMNTINTDPSVPQHHLIQRNGL